jgi:hypothetical protein
MNSSSEIRSANGPVACSPPGALADLDATLRLIANLPAPAGLEDRVFAGALAAPRGGRVLAWPQPMRTRNWMRSAAAAAIVLVVGGGGWGIYSHVGQREPAHAVVMPQRLMPPGEFSTAGAIRTPQTLNGPILQQQPLAAPALKTQPAQQKPAVKTARRKATATSETTQPAHTAKKPLPGHRAVTPR